jgi:hypothetical protein
VIGHANAQAVKRLYCRVIGGKSSKLVCGDFRFFLSAKQLLGPFINKLKKLFSQEWRQFAT